MKQFKSWYMLVVFAAFMSALMVSVISSYESQFSFLNKYSFQPEFRTTSAFRVSELTTQHTVDVGIFPLKIYDIDFQRNTFKMSAYVWMIWDANAEVDGTPINPPESFEITNIVDIGGFSKQELALNEIPGGKKYYLMKIDGVFFQNFDVSRYPLDDQQLNIVLEDTVWLDNELLYRPDTKDTRLSSEVDIQGWNITNINILADTHRYDTKFGLSHDTRDEAYSQLTFQINIERPIQFFAIKFVFPLSIILLFSLVAFWMPIDKFDVRIALSGSALLNLIFLQQLHSNGIVASQQLVLIDLLYIYAYVSVILTLIDMIYSNYRYLQKQDEHYIVARNRWVSLGHMLGLVSLVMYIVIKYA